MEPQASYGLTHRSILLESQCGKGRPVGALRLRLLDYAAPACTRWVDCRVLGLSSGSLVNAPAVFAAMPTIVIRSRRGRVVAIG
jgi:hypothetical protein